MVNRHALRLLAGSVVALVAAALGAASLDAHEVVIHRRLTQEALRFLVFERPELAACRAPEIEDALSDGVDHEDDYTNEPLGFFFYHFFPQLGDVIEGRKIGRGLAAATCDSITWGFGDDPACSARIALLPGQVEIPYLLQHDGLNPFAFGPTAISRLKGLPRTPAKTQGLITTGHLLHLLQDLTSPGHTRNDAHPHIPKWKLEWGDPSMFEVVNAARASDPIPFPSPGTLIPASEFVSEREAFRRLQAWTRANFYSEKNVLDGSGPVPASTDADGYVTDANANLLAWVDPTDGAATINAVVARVQFDRLAPEAIRWTASMLNFIHETRAPLCEQKLIAAVYGDGVVTSTADTIRSNPDDRISCGPGTPGSQRCEHYFPSGEWVELTATGGGFQGWLDSQGRPHPDCPGTGTCRVRMDGSDPKTVTADFGGDPVSGVYRLTAVDGRALPAPWFPNEQVESGELRFLDRGIPVGPDWDGLIAGDFFGTRFRPEGPERALLLTLVGPNAIPYSIGEVSDVPVPIPLSTPTVFLPPGRVIYRWLTEDPIATLAGNTMTVQFTTSLVPFRTRLVTLVKQPAIRSARFDPLNRTLSFPDTVQESTSPSRTITIANTGIEPLTVDGVLDFTSALNFSVSRVTHPACDLHAVPGFTSMLPPGESCSVELRFTPNLTYRTGPRTGTVAFRTNAGSTSGETFRTTVLVLEGTATGVPVLSVSPPTLAFPATAAGSLSQQTLSVQNTGDVPLVLFSPSVVPQASILLNFGMDATGCRDRSLPAGASCSIVVRYQQPAAAFSGTLNVRTNSGADSGPRVTTLAVPLAAENGRPVADAGPDQLDVRPGSMTVVDGSASTDLEGYPLTYVWRVLSAPPGSAPSLQHTMNLLANAGFVGDVPGSYVLQLVVNDGAQDSLPDTVTLNVQPPPGVVSPSPLGLTFPATPQGTRTASEPVHVTNTGGRAVTITAVNVTGEFGTSTNTCTTLAPQARCTIEVYFAPSAPGPRSGEITILSDASNSSARVLLSGALFVPPDLTPPRVTGLGEITFSGVWELRFHSGDDDEPSWLKIGNEPEFEWEEDESPGRVVRVDFGTGQGIVRIAEDNDGEDLRPLTLEPLPDGRYLLHLHNDDPPNEIEVTLVLQRAP